MKFNQSEQARFASEFPGVNVVYIIGTAISGKLTGPSKVGITTDIRRRVNGIQTSCPYPIAALGAFVAPRKEAARNTEKNFLQACRLEGVALRGEWVDIPFPKAIKKLATIIHAMIVGEIGEDHPRLEECLCFYGVRGALASLQNNFPEAAQ